MRTQHSPQSSNLEQINSPPPPPPLKETTLLNNELQKVLAVLKALETRLYYIYLVLLIGFSIHTGYLIGKIIYLFLLPNL